jgi:arylsulfatase
VIDLFPTTIELLGFQPEKEIRGVEQVPVQGTSLLYSFNDKTADSRHKVQHYYIFGSGAIYQDGWKASFAYSPNVIDISQIRTGEKTLPELVQVSKQEPTWELYNLNDDPTERKDLAGKDPKKLAELKTLFDRQAE